MFNLSIIPLIYVNMTRGMAVVTTVACFASASDSS